MIWFSSGLQKMQTFQTWQTRSSNVVTILSWRLGIICVCALTRRRQMRTTSTWRCVTRFSVLLKDRVLVKVSEKRIEKSSYLADLVTCTSQSCRSWGASRTTSPKRTCRRSSRIFFGCLCTQNVLLVTNRRRTMHMLDGDRRTTEQRVGNICIYLELGR